MQPARFHTLDALRGIAAIAVMLYHAGPEAPLQMARGYLAADLFFVLSGFVLAHSYQARLRDGLSFAAFALARLKRIYPLYWLGALIGCVLFAGSPLMILMLPSEPTGSTGMLFRANAPLWSLPLELVASLVWALLAVRIDWRALGAAILALGSLLAAAVIEHGGADIGATWATGHIGLTRTLFSFAIGIALFRLFELHGSKRRVARRAGVLLPALAIGLAPEIEAGALADLAALGIGLPALVWLAARWELAAPRLAAWLGGLSFPLYCIHAPFVAMGHASPGLMAAICAALVVAATLLDRWFDRPIQAWLKARAQRPCPVPQALA